MFPAMFGFPDSAVVVSRDWEVLRNTTEGKVACARNGAVIAEAPFARLSLCSNKVLVCADIDLKRVKTVSNLNQVKLVWEEVSNDTICLWEERVQHKRR